MTLLNFIKDILEFHAQTLSYLEKHLGDEMTVYILEKHTETNDFHILPHQSFFENCTSQITNSENDSFEELSNFVETLDLNMELKFYIWAFPIYRAIIEDKGSLTQTLKIDEKNTLIKFTDTLNKNLKEWSKNLPLPEKMKETFSDLYEDRVHQLCENFITQGRRQSFKVVQNSE